MSTSFSGPLPLSCHASAPSQQAMLWDCLRAHPDHPLRRADMLIHNTAYPYRHRLSARYASLFLQEHSRRARGVLEGSLYAMLCKRERDEKDRRSQEGIDAHDSQRGFGTLRSTFTTFGAYLEEYGEDDNPFSSGRHAIAMSTTDEEASPRPAGGGGAQRSMKSSSGLHKEAPADAFTPSQQQGYWLARLSLGDEGFAVGSVPMCSSSHARGPRYAKWDAEKLVQALGSVCTPYSAQEEARPTPPPSAGSARCQSTVLRAVYGEHPTHPSNEASVLIDELDNVSNCGSDDDAGSCVSSTTAFSSESEEEQGGIVQDFSAFPEPLQGADDVEGTTISSDTSTSGSSYIYYSEGEPDYEEGPEDEDSRSDGVFGGGAFGDDRGADPEHHSSVSNQS